MGKKGGECWWEKGKSSNTFRVINQMESALVEKRGSEKSIFKTRKFIKNIWIKTGFLKGTKGYKL